MYQNGLIQHTTTANNNSFHAHQDSNSHLQQHSECSTSSAGILQKVPSINLSLSQQQQQQHHHQQQQQQQLNNNNNLESMNTNHSLIQDFQKDLESTFLQSYNELSTPKLTSHQMMAYLKERKKLDCELSIFHAKVAQKSYGNEKRFFCPPPCIYLSGGWANRKIRMEKFYNQQQQLSAINPTNLEMRCYIGIGESRDMEIPQKLDFSNGKDFSSAKSLYISDQDKRKYFLLNLNIFYIMNNLEKQLNLGTFVSQRIKVISKPSKKKQSIKSNDSKYLCIANATKIALFNRLRSQTVSTRYLHVEDDKFNANSAKWGAFNIYLVDPKDFYNTNDQFDFKEGFVNYGSIIKLVDSVSKISLPLMRIRKIEKQMVVLEESENPEPVSQLHKCAFQFLNEPLNYLALNGESIISQRVNDTSPTIDATHHNVVDGAIWTIISTETTTYKFYEAIGPVKTPVTPVPIIKAVNMEASDTCLAFVELSGLNFANNLTVWLGSKPIETVYDNEVIRFQMPPLSEMPWDTGMLAENDTIIEFPLTLVRHDGVIYPSETHLRYQSTKSLNPLNSVSCDAILTAVPIRNEFDIE